MRTLRRVTSAALALTLAAGMNIMPVFAEQETANGSYTAAIQFQNASNPANASMCDPIFAHEANVELTDDSAELTFYVAYPLPAFSDQGADGTISDVRMTYDDVEYVGESDIDTKAVKKFDKAGAMFGINAGDELATQAVTVDLPREAVATFSNGIPATVHVDVVMNSDVKLVIKVTDLKKKASSSATTTDTQSAEVTASVASVSSDYEVTIPESIAMGTLSTTEDSKKTFTVNVENLESGKVEITTDAKGELESGANKLAFTNSFGTQTATAEKDLTGTITVKAADVKKAAAGNYTGVANFTIKYYAAE